MEGAQLRVGAWLMGIGGAGLVVHGVIFVVMAIKAALTAPTHLPGPISATEWSALDTADARFVLYLVAAVGLLGILSGVGAFGLAIFGVRGGHYWAWVTGVIAATCFAASIVVAHVALGSYAGKMLVPHYGIVTIYSIGLAMTRRFMR